MGVLRATNAMLLVCGILSCYIALVNRIKSLWNSSLHCYGVVLKWPKCILNKQYLLKLFDIKSLGFNMSCWTELSSSDLYLLGMLPNCHWALILDDHINKIVCIKSQWVDTHTSWSELVMINTIKYTQ